MLTRTSKVEVPCWVEKQVQNLHFEMVCSRLTEQLEGSSKNHSRAEATTNIFTIVAAVDYACKNFLWLLGSFRGYFTISEFRVCTISGFRVCTMSDCRVLNIFNYLGIFHLSTIWANFTCQLFGVPRLCVFGVSNVY